MRKIAYVILLVEAAWQSIRRSSMMRAFYDRIAERNADNRKVAIVATANKLARI